jgi:hypothetical protein
LFQLDYGYKPIAYPFKFNPALLKEESFGALVREVWSNKELSEVAGAQYRLTNKLKILKGRVKEWTMIRKVVELRSFETIEAEIANLQNKALIWIMLLTRAHG